MADVIMVDDRAGSQELITPLSDAGLPVEVTRLPFGDVAFMGRGVGGADCFIGLEHKRLSDLVGSLNSDRLAGHQLPGMVATFDRSYLVIEGDWDVDGAGRVVVPHKFRRGWVPLKGCPAASVLEQRVLTLATRGGLAVRWCKDQKASVRFIAALYRFWVDRPLDKHTSHLACHAPDLDPALTESVTLKRHLAAQLPGIGYAKSKAVDAHFRSVWAMVNATEADWQKVDGVGKKLAERIVSAVRETH